MDPLRYLLILAACVAVTLPLELVLGARVYRRPRRLLAVLAPVVAVFALWDLIAVARGHWWFSPRFTTGATLLGLPVEEWLFFVVVPLCALLTFEVLGRGPDLRRRLAERRLRRTRPTPPERVSLTRPHAAPYVDVGLSDRVRSTKIRSDRPTSMKNQGAPPRPDDVDTLGRAGGR